MVRSPFEVAILVACAVTGIVGLSTGSLSPAAITALFHGGAVAWNISVLAGGVGSLIGMWLRFPTNMLVERVGMIWLATWFTAYGVAILLVNTNVIGAIAGTGTVFAFAVACFARAWQLTSQLKQLRNALAQGRDV